MNTLRSEAHWIRILESEQHSTVALSDTSWVCLLLCNSAAPQLELQLRGLGKPNGMSVLSLRRRNIQPYTEIVYI